MRNKNLKRFLTTASALGMIAIGAQGASAGAVTTTAGATNYTGGLNGNVANWVNFNGAHALTIDADASAGVAGAFVTAAGASIVGTNHLKIGSIAGANTVTVNMADAKVLTLTGTTYGTGVGATAAGGAANNYSGLGTITLTGNTAGLTLAATVKNVTFTNDVLAAGGADGVFIITAGATGNTFTGNMGGAAGGNAFTSSTIGESVTFKPAAGKDGVLLGATTIAGATGAVKTVTIDSTNATGAVAVTGTIDGAVATQGGLIVNTVAQNITVGNNVGANAALNSIVAHTAATKTTAFTGSTKADVGGITVDGAGTTTFGGAVTTTGGGNITLGAGATTVGGVNVLSDGTITTGAGLFTAGGNVTATNNAAATGITIGAGGATITGLTTATKGDIDLTDAGASTFTGGIVTTAGNNGNLKIGANAVTIGAVASTISGAVTSAGGKLTTGAADFTVTNNASAASAITIGAGGAAFGQDVVITKGNLDLSADTSGTTVARSILMNGPAGQIITVGAGGAGAAAGLKVATSITFANAGIVQLAGNTLTLDGGGAVAKADIVTNKANTGTLNVNAAGGYAIDSNIGSTAGTTTAIDKIIATGGGVFTIGGAGSTTQIVAARNTTIGDTTTIAVNSTANSIAYSGLIDSAAAGNDSTLTIDGVAGKVVTFNDAIGSVAAIKTLTHGAGRSDTIYKGTVNVAQHIGAVAGSVVVFNKAVTAGGNVTANASTVTFNDTATIGGNLDMTNGVSTTTFNEAATIGTAAVTNASTLTFNKAVTVTGNAITLNTDTTNLNIRGNLTGKIVAGAAGRGLVTFGNGTNASITVSGHGGVGIGANGAEIKSVDLNLAGGTLKVASGTYGANATNFTTDGTLSLSAEAGSELGVVTTKTGGTGTIIVNQAALTTTGDIGTDGYGIKELKLANAAGALTVDHKIFGNVTTGAANTGTVTFGAAVVSSGLNIGTEAAPFSKITANTKAVTAGIMYAKDIETGVGGVLTAKAFNTTAATDVTGGTAVVQDKGTIGKVVTTNTNGTLRLDGSATMTGTVGAVGAGTLGALNLAGTAATHVVTFKDDAIFATTVDHKAATFKLEKATTIHAPTSYTATGSTFDIGANVLNINTPALNIAGDIKVNMSMGDRKAVFTGITAVNAAAPTDKVTLNISAGGGLLSGIKVINLFEDGASNVLIAAGNPLTTENVKRGTNSNRFITGLDYIDAAHVAEAVKRATDSKLYTAAKAAAEFVPGKLVITSSASLDKLTTSPKTPGVAEFANQIVAQFNDGTLKGDALKFVNTLGDLSLADSTKALNAVADRSVADVGNNVTGATVAAVTQAMTGRLDLTNAMLTASAGQGIAAGDSAEKFGVWAQVIGGTATQRMRKDVSGFQSRMAGMIVGGDTMISEKTTIGVLAGNAGSNVKHKDSKAGDKTKANSWLFGLYSSYDRIADTNFFTQGNLTVAQTTVNVKEGRIGAPTDAAIAAAAAAVPAGQAAGAKETAKAKYDVLGVAAEAIVGYKFMFDNSYVAPTVGLRYNYFGDTSYTQTGTTAQNLKVASKATSTVSGLAGVKLGTSVDMDGTNIMPEVHANMSYAFNSPSAKTTFAIDGMKDVAYKGPKPSKFGANFGAGVMAEADGFEYGVGYDANIGDKYLAHQGSLKVKVKF